MCKDYKSGICRLLASEMVRETSEVQHPRGFEAVIAEETPLCYWGR